MVTITASTKLSVPKKKPAAVGAVSTKKTAKRGAAPPLVPATLSSADSISKITDQSQTIRDLWLATLGQSRTALGQPHTASTTRDRSGAAADVAALCKKLGVAKVLKKKHDAESSILQELQHLLFPAGIEALFPRKTAEEKENENGTTSSLKPSSSALSLSSLVSDQDTATVGNSTVGTDSKRGKPSPPEAREGSLLLLRALCEQCGKSAEPYVVGAFLAAAVDECGSNNSAVRQAAEDCTAALVQVASPWAFPLLLSPLLLQSLNSSEWRVKAVALERIKDCANQFPLQVHRLIPQLLPKLSPAVWDTKAQVSKAARATLLAVCETNTNPDIAPAIKAVVAAIGTPSETNKAVSELMATTLVVPVDAPTLAILCPVLARALKERLAQHKRSACLVIKNLSKLVVSPDAIAPFGKLLVPELQKTAENVQFEEIRDEALSALKNLTQALGDQYKQGGCDGDQGTGAEEEQSANAVENARVTAEQERIKAERATLAKEEAAQKQAEEEERKRFKEAMEAQRQLDNLAHKEALEKKKAEEVKRDAQRRSTKGASGKCQACGLKKCPKSCMFSQK